MTAFNLIARSVRAASGTAVAAGLILLATPVSAHAQDTIQTTNVSIQAYELDSEAGRAAVLNRIERAAVRLCAPTKLAEMAKTQTCRAETVASMVRQSNSPLLVAQADRTNTIRTAAVAGLVRSTR